MLPWVVEPALQGAIAVFDQQAGTVGGGGALSRPKPGQQRLLLVKAWPADPISLRLGGGLPGAAAATCSGCAHQLQHSPHGAGHKRSQASPALGLEASSKKPDPGRGRASRLAANQRPACFNRAIEPCEPWQQGPVREGLGAAPRNRKHAAGQRESQQ